MAALTGRQIQACFGELLTIDTSNAQVIDTTERPMVGGSGAVSALKVSTTTVSSTGPLIGRGTFGSGTAMPDSGARTGWYWYPKKGAVLGGVVTGTQWDDANIGNYAVTFGLDNKASGVNSSVFGGFSNVASGTYSGTVGGYGNNSTGEGSQTLGGISNNASGLYSAICGGGINFATSDYDFVGGGVSNTASGSYSAVVGGASNVASYPFAFIGGGNGNLASTYNASCIGGQFGVADKFGQAVQASCSSSSAHGNMQTSILSAGNVTTNATATELFLDGSSAGRITLSNDTTWGFEVRITARRTDANDESAVYKIEGCIDRNASAATTALGSAIVKTVIHEDTAAWDATVTADTTNGSLKITVTGEASKTIRWSARVELTEVTG